MKRAGRVRKLMLGRETVRSLSSSDLARVGGGSLVQDSADCDDGKVNNNPVEYTRQCPFKPTLSCLCP